jgi:site-specific recombinase XerD
MSQARQIVRWLSVEFPNLQDLTEDDVRGKLRQLETDGFSPWTVMHWLTKTRLLIDRGTELGMVAENPARAVSRPQPKRVTPRVILEPDEARHILERSLHHRHWINGGIPTACRLGLYAGLRPEEMSWCQWHWLNSRRRRLEIQETVCVETGERWIPKDWEMRVIGVKTELVEFVADQKKWLKTNELLGPFMLPGGGARRSGFMNRPLSENAIQSAFRKMVAAEDLNPKITLYSFRHTFITELVRANVDLRTVQEIAGHSDIRTTEGYMHPLRAEKQTDGLPY